MPLYVPTAVLPAASVALFKAPIPTLIADSTGTATTGANFFTKGFATLFTILSSDFASRLSYNFFEIPSAPPTSSSFTSV